MDLSSAAAMLHSVPRSSLHLAFLLLCAVLATLTVLISLPSDSPHPSLRYLQSSSEEQSSKSSSSGNSGSGGIPVPMIVGFACNCVKRFLCEGWPPTRNGKIFWIVVYIVVNMMTFGVGGMVWLALYFARRFGLCSRFVGTVGKEISYTGAQVKAYLRVVQIMEVAMVKRSK